MVGSIIVAMPLDFGKYQGASQITEKCTFNNFEEYLEFSEIFGNLFFVKNS